VTIEVRILSGSRAGQRARFDTSLVSVGRHPLSDLRFDPDADLDVSTRHAELREADGVWTVFDQQSTNGTFVNGERIAGHRRLFDGDILTFGEHGPRTEVHFADAPRATVASSDTAAKPPRRDTNERIAEAVQLETASLRRMFALGFGALVVITAVAGALWQRRTSSREAELLALIARSESASVPLERTAVAMQARDSQFSRLLAERSSAVTGELKAERQAAGASTPEAMARISERLAEETRLRQAITLMDFPRVHDLNDAAVAMIASDLDGTYVAATAFSVSAEGLLVTNRHVMRTKSGAAPQRIRVLFANTTGWRAARLVRVSDDDDLALLQMEGTGPFPVVAGVSRTGRDTRVGSPVATIGYPHAVDTPMEGSGLDVRARTTTTAGTVSKRLADVLQIDSYAGKGSSGSPVFDVRGNVVGVIYGGEAESRGRIVYAVPAERLAAFLTEAGAGAVLR
jgi:S1-C subfamily serine protease